MATSTVHRVRARCNWPSVVAAFAGGTQRSRESAKPRYISAVSDFDFRFGGIGRLFGSEALNRLRAAHVCVVGIGGVGAWSVEALARSGVGKLTLMDLDEICVSNVNRQLHALNDAVGRAKVDVMAERVRGINPECKVRAVTEFFTEANARELLASPFDYVVDAIDSVSNKCLLI